MFPVAHGVEKVVHLCLKCSEAEDEHPPCKAIVPAVSGVPSDAFMALTSVNVQSDGETIVFVLLTGCVGVAGETCQVEVFTSPDPPVSKVLT